MSVRSDIKALEDTIRALKEARDVIERTTQYVGAVTDSDALEAMLDEAHTRYLERFGRYETEPHHEAEREAVRAAVEPYARHVIGIEASLADRWNDFQRALTETATPEDAFRAVVQPIVVAVGPARRQRRALRKLWALLEDGRDTVPAAELTAILQEVGPLAKIGGHDSRPKRGSIEALHTALADRTPAPPDEPSYDPLDLERDVNSNDPPCDPRPCEEQAK